MTLRGETLNPLGGKRLCGESVVALNSTLSTYSAAWRTQDGEEPGGSEDEGDYIIDKPLQENVAETPCSCR